MSPKRKITKYFQSKKKKQEKNCGSNINWKLRNLPFLSNLEAIPGHLVANRRSISSLPPSAVNITIELSLTTDIKNSLYFFLDEVSKNE